MIQVDYFAGILYEFFRKLGIEQLRFKPAYNPYTEPSMEIFSYHPGLGKWVEVVAILLWLKMFHYQLSLLLDWQFRSIPP